MAGKRGRGRPLKELDKPRILALCSNACTVDEIAADQDCSKDTIERNFAAVVERGRDLARVSLRSKQFQVAMGKPAQPAVYLRERVDEKGRQQGALVLDEKGHPIRIQEEQAGEKPSIAMLIWLGKNLLGQSEKVIWETGDGFEFDQKG